jgi:MFS transporter, OPA family, glycerol-3-phosphate transporter
LWCSRPEAASRRDAWITALAYACTGVVQQGLDQWFPKCVRAEFGIDMKSVYFLILAFGIPLVAMLGSLISGYVSDIFFKGKRAPVAAALYLIETVRSLPIAG